LEVVSLIGVAGRRRADAATPQKEQPELFPAEPDSGHET
jgi:hypothetical protein